MLSVRTLLFAFACLWAGGFPHVHAQGDDPYHAQLFATLDRSVAAVGEEVVYTAELLAVPETEAAEVELRAAFLAAEPEGRGFVVSRSEVIDESGVEGVLELKRLFYLRVATDSTVEIGSLSLDIPAVPKVRAPAFEVVAYRKADRFEHVRRSVVSVEVSLDEVRRLGSGFVIDADVIATAYHVIAGADQVTVHFANGHRVRVKEVVALDPERDVALLYIPPADVRRGNASSLPFAPDEFRGRVAFTAGWPSREQVVTEGRRYADVEVATGVLRVSDNPIEPGDSGGPLFDSLGRVLGVVVSGRPVREAPDVLRESVAIASDPRPAIRARFERPRALARALFEASGTSPSARVLETSAAVQAVEGPVSERLDVLSRIAAEPVPAPLVQYLGGSVLEAAGREQTAREAFSRVEAYFPAQYALAHQLLRLGDYEGAVPIFQVLYKGQPYRHLGAFGLARARIGQRRYAEARAALEVVLAKDPYFVPALFMRGLLYVESGEPVKAAAIATRLRAHAEWANRLRLAIENREMGLPPAVRRPWAALTSR